MAINLYEANAIFVKYARSERVLNIYDWFFTTAWIDYRMNFIPFEYTQKTSVADVFLGKTTWI